MVIGRFGGGGGRRRRRYGPNFFLGSFYLNLGAQYATTVISAIVLAGFVFSGFLLFRYADRDDLMARGKRQLEEGKVAWACKTFQTLVTRYKDSYDGHIMLGQSYLELGERAKAEDEFGIAYSLNPGHLDDSTIQIAKSKLLIAQKNFDQAESQLLAAYKRNQNDDVVRGALYDLYSNWGDTLLQDQKDSGSAIVKYENALRYVSNYTLEDKINDKLTNTITDYTNQLETQGNYAQAIQMLKISLKHRYLPDTLIAIAGAYERSNDLDNAIYWYRQAFDADPKLISIKLSNMLVQKGQQLLNQKDSDKTQPGQTDSNEKEAEKYFKEADEISKAGNVPLSTLYPVDATTVSVTSEKDEDTGEFLPRLKVRFDNRSPRDLNFLRAKAMFYADDELIEEVIVKVATPESPLAHSGEKGNSITLEIEPTHKLNINQFNGKSLQVKIAIAYNEETEPDWQVKLVQNVRIVGHDEPDAAPTPASPV